MTLTRRQLGGLAAAATAQLLVVSRIANNTNDCPPEDHIEPAQSTVRVASSDLRLVGSFTVPTSSGGDDTSLEYSGDGLGYNPANDSLFLTGHNHFQRTAEITIPQLSGPGATGELTRATFLQTPVDATGGQLGAIAQPPTSYGRIGGYLVIGERLIVSGYHYYDAGNTQVSSHFAADTELGRSNTPFALSRTIPARWLGGAMSTIPTAWQADFGGDQFLTGLSGIPIVSNASVGPAAASFSPADVNGAAGATLLVGYPLAQPFDSPEAQSHTWNLTSEVKGIVFPEGTGSVLFFGTHGTGSYCYGTGPECGDPEDPYQGTHAAPYRYQVWAYDARDLANVYAGDADPESLRPYDVWELELPTYSPVHAVTGVAYDASTNRIFVGKAEPTATAQSFTSSTYAETDARPGRTQASLLCCRDFRPTSQQSGI